MDDGLPRFLPRKLIPRDLLELLAFVPNRGWDAIEWRPLLEQLRRIGWQMASRKGVSELMHSTVNLTDACTLNANPGMALEALTEPQKQIAGDSILRFYFAQFKNPAGMFIDLRAARFSYVAGVVQFAPSGLHARLDEDFRLGMIDLYRGFYTPDPEILDQALYRMGFLRKGMPAAEISELKNLLETHFGTEQRSQLFSLDAFRDSFDALFDFFIDKGYSLRSDFVMVGFYLITLYMALEKLGQRHDVKALWDRETD